jgi:hypothetical protein
VLERALQLSVLKLNLFQSAITVLNIMASKNQLLEQLIWR